jgi:hypothetical protein
MMMLKALGIAFHAEKFSIAGLSGADVARGAMSRDQAAFVGLSPKDFEIFENEFTQLCLEFAVRRMIFVSVRTLGFMCSQSHLTRPQHTQLALMSHQAQHSLHSRPQQQQALAYPNLQRTTPC